MHRVARSILASALAVLAAGAPGGGPVDPDRSSARPPQGNEPDVPRFATAELQLAHAAELKQRSRSALGRERAALRELAVAAYAAVREHFPEDAARGAEAAFRAGELLRADGESQRALAEFRIAHALGRGTAFRARAGLEIGHVLRRSGEAQPALDAYFAVALDSDAGPLWREEATLWAGRVYAERGDPAEARRLFSRIAQVAEDPVHRVDAYDELALLLVDDEDLEGAAGVLERARAALADVALEETEQGERVRNALERMRAVTRLQKKVAERTRRVRIGGVK